MNKIDPKLPSLQQYVHDVCKARGWDSATNLETFLLFTEEVGELARAIRKQHALFIKKGTDSESKQALAEEFADVFSYLLDLANRYEIDLYEAFCAKEEVNAGRDWPGKEG
ncbi:MAG: MazG nucleotide pyrophosphohydrolase domain-containing protein [Bacteroidia bacterium]